MLDVKFSDFKIDSSFWNGFVDVVKKFWYGIPKWLQYILIIVTLIGASFYAYNKVSIAYDIKELQDEIKELNEKYKHSVVVDRYQYDVENIVLSVRTFQEMIGSMYNDQDEMTQLFEEYVKRNHPNDPILEDIKRVKKRMQYTREVYGKTLQHQLHLYDNFDASDDMQK